VKRKVTSLYGYSPALAPFAGKSPAEAVDVLRRWGITVVFGGHQDPRFVEAARQAGLKVYAEFGCFVGRDWWDRVPSSRPITDAGVPLAEEGTYCGVNPSTPEVRQAQWAAFEQLLLEYDLDGVWLDFIRWPCHWEVHHPQLYHTSFDRATLARFGADLSLELPTEPAPAANMVLRRYPAEWTAWRCRQITSWAAGAREILRRCRPQAIMGLFGVPWRLADHDQAILRIIGQDYRALGQHVDVLSPMVYHLMCGREPGWIDQVVSEVHALSGTPVWPIIQSVDMPTALSALEYDRALEVALGSPASDGVLVFTMQGALDPDKLARSIARFATCSST
jgi:hypothetical protein